LLIVLQITSRDFTNSRVFTVLIAVHDREPIASATSERKRTRQQIRRLRCRWLGVRPLVPQVYDREKSYTGIAPEPFYNPVMPVTSIFPNKRSCDMNRVPKVESAMTWAFSKKIDGHAATIAECAENARQSKWFASKTKNEEERKFLLHMAKRWTELAAEKERELRDAARSAG
jgi:hypothetical protein